MHNNQKVFAPCASNVLPMKLKLNWFIKYVVLPWNMAQIFAIHCNFSCWSIGKLITICQNRSVCRSYNLQTQQCNIWVPTLSVISEENGRCGNMVYRQKAELEIRLISLQTMLNILNPHFYYRRTFYSLCHTDVAHLMTYLKLSLKVLFNEGLWDSSWCGERLVPFIDQQPLS